jgi:hypothetical protein
VPLQDVRVNFARFGLLDDQVVFLQGWFRTSLPPANIERLAVLRIDAVQATAEALNYLYDKVSPSGYVIVDGYGSSDTCRTAVNTFRRRAWVTAPLVEVDHSAVYWKKPDPAVESDSDPAAAPGSRLLPLEVDGDDTGPVPAQDCMDSAVMAFVQGNWDQAVHLATLALAVTQ